MHSGMTNWHELRSVMQHARAFHDIYSEISIVSIKCNSYDPHHMRPEPSRVVCPPSTGTTTSSQGGNHVLLSVRTGGKRQGLHQDRRMRQGPGGLGASGPFDLFHEGALARRDRRQGP